MLLTYDDEVNSEKKKLPLTCVPTIQAARDEEQELAEFPLE